MSRHEDERTKLHEQLKDRLVLFIPDLDDSRFGIGYFRLDDGFQAYRKMANGFERYPCWSIEDKVLRQLLPHLPQETK